MRRIHQLNVQLTNGLFLDRQEGGYALSVDVLTHAALRELGLQPLLAYSLSVPGTGLHAAKLSQAGSPQAIITALVAMWTECEWLKGVPDELQVSSALANAAADALQEVRNLGVVVSFDHGKSRQIEANRRSIQKELRFAPRLHQVQPVPLSRRDQDWETDTVRELNALLHEHFDGSARSWSCNPSTRACYEEWRQLEQRPSPKPIAEPVQLDWTPGIWTDIGFRNAVEPRPNEGVYYLPDTRTYAIQLNLDSEDVQDDSSELPDTLPVDLKAVRVVLAASRLTVHQLAKSLGLTSPSLQAFLDIGYAVDEAMVARLLKRLGFALHNEVDRYRPATSYVFVDRPGKTMQICDAMVAVTPDGALHTSVLCSASEADGRRIIAVAATDLNTHFALIPSGTAYSAAWLCDQFPGRIVSAPQKILSKSFNELYGALEALSGWPPGWTEGMRFVNYAMTPIVNEHAQQWSTLTRAHVEYHIDLSIVFGVLRYMQESQ